MKYMKVIWVFMENHVSVCTVSLDATNRKNMDIKELKGILNDHHDDDQDVRYVSDGHHTFDELYRYRMLYHAAFVNANPADTVKSWWHSDGELCFGGGWFIVVTVLPTGQISNHYRPQFWELFNVRSVDADHLPVYDFHSSEDAADRLEAFIKGNYAL